ncbi:PH domain-containing protein [Halobacillus salinarum]|uniref:PH domain-containing protein n=1 Tax=Halobacillus salinarum TaxID=2932257 RepID=A0ABY4EQ10_9BACI|nr:PH domain-containing protein [Halobacillus salinarum]UOQ46002.1 PH domain-containing protein [Halobacillus salinarum]
MFKKIASDALGLSDVGSVIKPEDYDKVDADDYVMHEDDEKIYFLIKSKADEYCFTNKALIHVDGESAASKKRTLRRYPYRNHHFTNIELETAGTIDLDVEIKFQLGNTLFDIEVHKKFIEELKDLYKSLLKIAEITEENQIFNEYAKDSLQYASTTLQSSRSHETKLSEEFHQINESAFDWLVKTKAEYHTKDFGPIFDLFIHN